MADSNHEIAFIVTVGTSVMLTLAVGIVCFVIYIHGKMMKNDAAK